MQRLSILILVLAGFVTSCGTCAADDLSGCWSGYWISDSTGHRGPLRCTLTRLSDGSYQADFAGRFFKILPFRYSVVLYVQAEGETVHLSGQHELGRRIGVFSYQAAATSCDFVAHYSSCKDQGRFVLER